MKPLKLLFIALAFIWVFVANSVVFFIVGFWVVWYHSIKTVMQIFWSGCPEWMREALPMFDSNNLLHNVKHLDKMQRKIVFLSTAEQAKYVDGITYKAVKSGVMDEELLADMNRIFEMPDAEKGTAFYGLNATAIGNIAYMSLYSKNQQIQLVSGVLLSQIFQHFNQFK